MPRVLPTHRARVPWARRARERPALRMHIAPRGTRRLLVVAFCVAGMSELLFNSAVRKLACVAACASPVAQRGRRCTHAQLRDAR